ncbi:AMP-binding protein [Streptomyces sp. AC563]|uniref:AMP-binding protein n=1 Tax=Streptomyces buecherae TaxID=2763006 RepID=UPI00164DED5D|nr:AMP-binding protein [Streptomyces buecherae]MBC3988218.1 AMP-binding protein [Streptomyces buecherae]
MWVAHLVRRHRQRRPDALAVVAGARELTWRELDARTDALASALLDRGVRRGERIAVSSPNRAEVLELYVAAAKAGVIVCPVNHTFPGPEVAYVIDTVEPVGVFAERSVLDRHGDVLGDGWRVTLGSPVYEAMATGPVRTLPLPRQDDIHAILHTSATTGRAKGVTVTHRSLSACYTGMAAELGFGPGDVMVNPCPLFHGSMVIGLALLAAGGTLVLEPEFTPERFLADVARHRATRAFLVPAMVRAVLRAATFDAAELATLTEVMCGGAPIPDEVLREALERFPCPLRNVYGITEGGGPIAAMLFDRAHVTGGAAGIADATAELRLRSAGRMLPGCHIEIHDRAGRRVPPGEIGELCVRGDGRMLGYWGDEAATAEVLRDGWLRTGDAAYADPDGYLYLVDRLRDVIDRGGRHVYPAEVERVLAAQPGVADVAVVGEPCARWGEVPVAFVAAAEPAPRASALLAACVAELAGYKRPARVVFVPEVPRSTAGKVLRRVLRAGLGQPATGAHGVPDRTTGARPATTEARPTGAPSADTGATDTPTTDVQATGAEAIDVQATGAEATGVQAAGPAPGGEPATGPDVGGPGARPSGADAASTSTQAPTDGAAQDTSGSGEADLPPATPAKGV